MLSSGSIAEAITVSRCGNGLVGSERSVVVRPRRPVGSSGWVVAGKASFSIPFKCNPESECPECPTELNWDDCEVALDAFKGE